MLLTIRQAAAAGYASEGTLRKLVKTGKIPALMAGNRAYIARSVLESLGGEEEYLLKNDTKLITTKIQKVKTHTISTMKFVKTSSKGKIISQKNKKHSSNGAYWLITLNLEN